MATALELFLLASMTGPSAPAVVATDPTQITVSNPTSGTAIVKAWGMVPGTPVAGTVMSIDTELTGTWEGNALAIGVLINGTFTAFTPSVGASSWSAAAVIAGWLRLTVRVLTASTARFAIYGALGETATSVTPGSGTVALTPVSQTLTVAASDTIALGCLFGASNGSQGVATYGSTFVTISAA